MLRLDGEVFRVQYSSSLTMILTTIGPAQCGPLYICTVYLCIRYAIEWSRGFRFLKMHFLSLINFDLRVIYLRLFLMCLWDKIKFWIWLIQIFCSFQYFQFFADFDFLLSVKVNSVFFHVQFNRLSSWLYFSTAPNRFWTAFDRVEPPGKSVKPPVLHYL